MEYIDLLGKRFEYGGTGPDTFDCKGLVFELYKRLNIKFPDYNSPSCVLDQHTLFKYGLEHNTIQIEKPEPYCMVMFRIKPPYVTHMGLVLEDCFRFIHIMPKSSVTVERLDNVLWVNKIAGLYRLKHE